MCIGTVELLFSLKRRKSCPAVAQLVRALSHKLKGHRFDSQPGYKRRLQVQSLVRAHMRDNLSMFLCLSPSLLPPLPKINKCVLR